MAVDFWGRREVGDERGHICPIESEMMMIRVEMRRGWQRVESGASG